MTTMTAQAINDLDDDQFAYIQRGGTKDATGRTVPRSYRHFPIHDVKHVRDALARALQSPFGRLAMPAILQAAKRFGIAVGRDSSGEAERRYLVAPDAALRVAGEDVDGQRRIAGYAAIFNRTSKPLGGFVEQIDAGAFNRAQADGWPGAVCRYNHDSSFILGTTRARTLILRVDQKGLLYSVVPPQSRADILELVARGDVAHSSFAFRVREGGEDWTLGDARRGAEGVPLRRVLDCELVDVAPVVNPAYEDTSSGLRSLARHVGVDEAEVRALADEGQLDRLFRLRSGAPLPRPTKVGAEAVVELRLRGEHAAKLIDAKRNGYAEANEEIKRRKPPALLAHDLDVAERRAWQRERAGQEWRA